jgi:hypothetical protein
MRKTNDTAERGVKAKRKMKQKEGKKEVPRSSRTGTEVAQGSRICTYEMPVQVRSGIVLLVVALAHSQAQLRHSQLSCEQGRFSTGSRGTLGIPC